MTAGPAKCKPATCVWPAWLVLRRSAMGAKSHTDLLAWQLAHDLKLEVWKLTASGQAHRDGTFCDQIRSSICSVTAHIMEGFWLTDHKEFGRCLLIARGSLAATQRHLMLARDQGYIDALEFERLWLLSRRDMTAISRLLVYLRATPDPPGCTVTLVE